MSQYTKIERTFPLPKTADADLVSETVRGIIATAVSTERLVLTTNPPEIHAEIYINSAPESEEDPNRGLWETLHSVPLENPEKTFADVPLVLDISRAIQHLSNKGRIPTAVLCQKQDVLWERLGLTPVARLLGLPVLELDKLPSYTLVVLGGSTALSGIIHSTCGVLVDLEDAKNDDNEL